MRGPGDAHRDAGRGWGPFTGRQLTTIICVVAVMVMLPVSAFAVVSGSNAFITDHTTGAQAKVNAAGQVLMSGTVGGAVIATPTSPSQAYSVHVDVGSNSCAVTTPPAGKVLVITSISTSLTGTDLPALMFTTGVTTPTNCNGPRTTYASLNEFSSAGTSQTTFPSGFPIKSGHGLAVFLSEPLTGDQGAVVVTGYLVPAAQCATGCY